MNNTTNSPLNQYREKASFDWRALRTFLQSDDDPQQNRFYDELRKHPTLLSKSSITPSQEDLKRMASKHLLDLIDIRKKLTREMSASGAKVNVTGPSSSMRHGQSFDLFASSVAKLGTERHQEFCRKGDAGEIIGTFALTEVGHGTNTKSMQTTATYDRDTKEFIIHTPNFYSAKCWMGNLGKKATHIILYAQLIMPDNKNHGLHAFVVNVRNPLTLLPYPGISITDIGEKIGLKQLDNGLIMFNKYRIPKENLLNRLADVNDDGVYISTVVNPKLQFANSLSMLSTARVNIAGFCTEYMRYGITIAIRNASVVKQRLPENGRDLPILENPAHQIRLTPCLALAYVGHVVFGYLAAIQSQFTSITDEDVLINLGNEYHALSSAAKPVSSWLIRDFMKDCKEICGSHVYLTISEMEEIYGEVEPSSNYEGDNYVLTQQCANFLLKLWPIVMRGGRIDFPLSSVNFLSNAKEILKCKFTANNTADFVQPENILTCFQWLTCYLLKETFEKQQLLGKSETNPFWIKNNSQVYYCRALATAYILTFYIDRFRQIISNTADIATKTVLIKLLSLYGVWNLHNYVHYFYQGGFAIGAEFGHMIENVILKLCMDLKDDIVALVDAIAPPDFLLNSVFGHSDGHIYERLESTITHTPETFSKAKWRGDVSEWKYQLSKL
ncbi:hypothetical protein PPYR_12174 [Photinus pyralis]|uniref:Acyl-coenzyme A oxidase n=1 Tax=Photinus pyralis TaxID=7054 RepID=A0A5N4ADE2_PHOPY|nr:peroxisomal acyl-coenzyme A oxidase 3-like [Photinus pyralis]XP_031352227.1 peroxisomal acyl-coenzyme A oxidase 3-like [Photinus pyralis]KAB0795335.1 hypothetical protein PPYR_12174 [Photinus pyralis]